MNAEVVAAVAAVIAALASLGALGTSAYGIRHASSEARKLEQIRWHREKLVDQVESGVLAARGLLYAMQERDFSFDPDANMVGLLGVRNIELVASGELKAAAAKLSGSSVVGNSIIKSMQELGAASAVNQEVDDMVEATATVLKQDLDAFHEVARRALNNE